MTSLRTIDLGSILAGDAPDLSPIMLRTTANQALLYAGINTLFAEPSLGKTLVAERAAAEVLAAGGAVVMIDWEDTAATFVERMRALGVADELLERGRAVVYMNVEGALDDEDRETLLSTVELLQVPDDVYRETPLGQAVSVREWLEEPWLVEIDYPRQDQRPVLVIVDAYAPALAADGVPENDNGEVTGWTNATLRPLARAGAVVLVLDHVQKDPTTRTRGGRGAGAKLALVDGAAYELRPIHAFARTQAGSSKLVIAKDRPGLVGPIGATAAIVHFEPTGDGGLEIRLEPPEPTTTDDGTFRPTTLMERISTHLERLELVGEPCPTGRELEHDVDGKATALRAGLRCLVEEKFVERVPDGKRIGYRLLHPFDTSENPPASLRPNSVPTASPTQSNPSASLRPPRTTSGDAGRSSNGTHQHANEQSASPSPDPFWADAFVAIAADERDAPIPDEDLLAEPQGAQP